MCEPSFGTGLDGSEFMDTCNKKQVDTGQRVRAEYQRYSGLDKATLQDSLGDTSESYH